MAITFSICAAFLLRATCHAAELAEDTAFASPKFGATPATPTPDFEPLRIKGLTVALPGPQDTIDLPSNGCDLTSVGRAFVP
jgi:porin